MSSTKRKVSLSGYAWAIWEVMVTSYKAAPGIVVLKFFGVIVNSLLPIAVTYFAALTTTALAAAYAGDAAASKDVYLYILITAGLGLLQIAWSSIESYLRQTQQYVIDVRISDRMYEHFLTLDYWRYDDKKTIDLYERGQNFSRFFSYVFDRIADLITQVVTIVFALLALSTVSPLLAVIICVAVVPGFYVQLRLSRMQAKHWSQTTDTRRARWDIENSFLQPNSIAELRLYNLVRHILDLRQKLRDDDEKERIIQERNYVGKRLLSDAIEAVTEVGSLLWVATQVIAQAMPIGQFIYVQQMVSRAFGSAGSFVNTISTIDEDLANLFDYQAFMKLKPRQLKVSVVEQVPEAITFDDVSFRYRGTKHPVLRHVSLTIKKNQHVAIIGENGAGKSTLIKLLVGFYLPTSGKVLLDGQDVAEIDPASWHRYLSVLQQTFLHYTFTRIKDNVLFGDVSKPPSRERYLRALGAAEAKSFVDKLPKGDATFASRWMGGDDENSGTELSGGQWQRIALARNFYRDAPIIILDEPTSAIDGLAESRIFSRLFAERDKTIITVSHRLSTVKRADVIYVLKDGMIVEHGTHEQLVARAGEYVKIFESQLG